jgi:hypothetical protein
MICDCSIDVDEGATCAWEEWRTARKPHVCCECRETIEPGETYEHARGVWGGRWYAYRTCAPCARIRQDYCRWGWEYGALAEQIEACLGFNYRELEE